MAQTQTMNAPQRRKIEINQRQKVLLFGMLFFLVVFGVIGTAYGFIGDESGLETTTNNESTIEMPVTEAKNKPIEEIEKEGSSLDELNPTSVNRSNLSDMNLNNGTSLPNPLSQSSGNLITNSGNTAGPRSNSYTLEQERGIQSRFDAIEKNSSNLNRQAYGYTVNNTPQRTRSSMNNETLQYVNRNSSENSSLINDIYSGKPTNEYQQKLNQEAATKAERQSRQDKYDDMLMKMVENENKRRESSTGASSNETPFTTSSGSSKINQTSQISSSQVPAFAKNRKTVNIPKTEEESFNDALNGNGGTPTSGQLVKSDIGFPQITSQKSENAFFGLNGKRTEVNRKRGRYETVEGVIHGSGDGITVTNGSTIKIRITSETKLQLQGEELVLQPNTLITGVCAISGDRVNIKVNSLRIDNFLYPVTMMVYDLDGQQGVYVKDLAQKTQLSTALVQSAGQTMQPSYFIGQGGIGNQVGTQLATSTLQNVSNVGRNLLTTKVAQVRAFIRPNYRVLLKFTEANNNNQ